MPRVSRCARGLQIEHRRLGSVVAPAKVQLSISGLLNHTLILGHGTLTVDSTTGTKYGTVTYSSPPPQGSPGGDTVPIGTSRCFIGARHVGRERFVDPLDLLGREFVSVRYTTIGRRGTASLSETARTVKDVLHSTLTVIGRVATPALQSTGPLTERIKVSKEGTLVSEGRYSLITKGGRSIRVRYTHFYRSLKPNRNLFRRSDGQVFLLRAEVTTRRVGRTLVCRTKSTLRRLMTRRPRDRD